MADRELEEKITERMKVYGIVQGVGFRPSVARHAADAGITGYVCNKGPYVEIIAQGERQAVDRFTDLLRHKAPSRSVILKIDIAPQKQAAKYDSFEIAVSEKTSGEIFIPPDIATCDDCTRELFDPGDRRYLHPFINCTSCGPRLTILDALPYDRERTSMKMFPMCRICSHEYHDPASRRYDAQPVCCNECGPQVYIVSGEGGLQNAAIRGSDAIEEARRVIKSGGIVAVKGIGGFHLCCDAGNETAVQLLRERKRRPRKPFAVMMRDVETVRTCCHFEAAQEEILTGHQKPILLMAKQDSEEAARILCDAIAPGNPTVGVMLPYAPVQMLLMHGDMPPALVMTSGNISGAPICREDTEAISQLGHFCDCILSHDRRIRIRADDSVMDFYQGEPYMIRRSRGYAPLPYMLTGFENSPKILAVGGELKNTFCISRNSLFYPSSYIGDLADPRSIEVLRETAGRYSSLLEVQPEVVACDLHPGYHSTEYAQELVQQLSERAGKPIPLVSVQHHYAHIASCMAENDYNGKVIGVAMDGTGYGTDGTIWGGEILLADYQGFERAGSIRPFAQAGGDSASREGWRIAAGMLHTLHNTDGNGGDTARDAKAEAVTLGLCTEQEASVVMAMIDHRLNTVTSTSAGRLFDAVSAILGICRKSSFEGEASMDLEFAAERHEQRCRKVQEERSAASAEEIHAAQCGNVPSECADEAFALPAVELSPVREDGRWIMPTERIVKEMADAMLQHRTSVPAGDPQQKASMPADDPQQKGFTDRLAWQFHRMLADAVIECVCAVSRESGIQTAALSGGCFQNRLLLAMTEQGLTERGFTVLRHHLVPPNDGGIALGQAVIAAQKTV